MKSKINSILNWLRINFGFFILFFIIVWALIAVFPETMLRLFGKWTILLKAAGAKNAEEIATKSNMFTHILISNGITMIFYFAIGLFLQSILVMVFTGAFYSFIVFLAPLTIGRSFSLNDWLLISAELLTLLLSISLSSALGGDLYGVKSEVKDLFEYWKHNWRKLLPKPVKDWRLALKEWGYVILLTVIVIIVLSVFVAWYETYGY